MEISDIQAHYMRIIHENIKSGNIDKAIDVAISSYFLSRQLGDEHKNTSKSILYVAFSAYFNFDEKEIRCSFCGRPEDEVLLTAGSDAYICDECVILLSKRQWKKTIDT